MQKLAYLNYPYEYRFKTLWQFSFACFKLLDSFSLKSDSETLQHEVLPDNCQLKTFEICCVELLLRMLVPFPFKWTLLLFRWLGLIFFTVISEKEILSVTHFLQMMVDFVSLFIQFRFIRSDYNWWDTNIRFIRFSILKLN